MLNLRTLWQPLLPLLASCGSAPSEAPKKSSSLIDGCEAALDGFKNQGLIQSHPFAIRAEADDALWATLQDGEKVKVLEALTCVAFEGERPRGKDYVVIYGYDTGQRLAVVSKFGAQFDPVILDERTKLPDFGP